MDNLINELSNTNEYNNHLNLNDLNVYTSGTDLYELKGIISSVKDDIQQGNIVKKKNCEIAIIVQSIIAYNDESEEYQHVCSDFIKFLEIHTDHYKNKYNDLLNHILENLTNDDKQACYRDHNGKIVLLSKPRLERSYNVNHNIKNNKMYKLILSITNHIKNIVQHENDYNVNISTSSNASVLHLS